MPSLFNARDSRYRSPTGAVESGTSVFFRICLPRDWHCSGAWLNICPDQKPDEEYGMFWAGMEGSDHEWWDCHYTPSQETLYWYGFSIQLPGGRYHLVRQPDSTAARSGQPGTRWQLTSYRPGMDTPDWLSGGVMYQIFPDRFARSGQPKSGVPADRVLRSDWGGQPVWQPDSTGQVRNNDFFGGDLKGIEQRLDRLAELGVTCLYLNPIFEAHSNHRYDTADYEKIDPLLGNEEDFRSLCRTAATLGIRIILDGVFSHTGADSRYFNRTGRYGEREGAYRSMESPYYPWYHFQNWPHQYTGWWGFTTLPEVNENHPAFKEYILGKNGIVRRWLAAGASGWRLDVADELPDEFLDGLRQAAKAEKPDALVLGEVWEDASRKESYGHRRRYLLGDQLDSVMNYPFREAVLTFLTGGDSAGFYNTVGDIVEHYPRPVLRLLMNHIGTHDTERALTVLAGEPAGGRGRSWQAQQSLSAAQRKRGLRLLRLAAVLQYCLPGVPCLYYGDEAGMEGYRDPFNRGCYPWGREDKDLLAWYHKLGQIRRISTPLREGDWQPLDTGRDVVAFVRTQDETALLCAVNHSDGERTVALPPIWQGRTVNLGGGWTESQWLHLPPLECAVMLKEEPEA